MYKVCSDKVYMSHQRSLVHHIFPLDVQQPEKYFLMKNLSENQQT